MPLSKRLTRMHKYNSIHRSECNILSRKHSPSLVLPEVRRMLHSWDLERFNVLHDTQVRFSLVE